nr:hypothetical protein [Azohydromonas aeria]
MNQKTLPPSRGRAPALPPMSSASRRVMASPSPGPPCSRVVEALAC